MNILNKLTIKHLKMNKKRTIVTIIGVILSTALMVGIGLLFSTFREILIDDIIKYNGDYHTEFTYVPSKKMPIIANNVKIKDYFYSGHIGYAYLSGGTNEYKPYLDILEVSDNYFDELKLIEGRLPENNNEVVISKHIETNGGVKYKVGDVLNLDIGERYLDGELVSMKQKYASESYIHGEELQIIKSKQYTIVGIVERSIYESFSHPGYSIFTVMKNESDYFNVYVHYKKVNDAYKVSEDIASKLGFENVGDDNYVFYREINYNDSLLAMYGVSQYENMIKGIAGVLGIILGLISVGCIVVIYNSFAISVMERKKQFGLFSSVGATKKQIRKTVFFEAFIVGTIGIVLGLLSGFLGIFVVIKILDNLIGSRYDFVLKVSVYPLFIIIPIIFMIIVIILSAYLPAKRASKISPIEAIRLNDDIKIKRRKLKTNRLVKRLFGIEGELALKNIKRNKRKYRITLASLFISIVMFITFSSFIDYIFGGATEISGKVDYDIIIYLPFENNWLQATKLEKVNSIINHEQVEQVVMMGSSVDIYTDTDFSKIYTEEYKKKFEDFLKFDQGDYINIVVVRNEDFNSYLKTLGYKQEKPILLNTLKGVDYTRNSRKNYEIKKYESNDLDINLCRMDDYDVETDSFLTKDCYATIDDYYLVNKELFGTFEFLNVGEPILIISENMTEYYSDTTNFNVYIKISASEYDALNKMLDDMTNVNDSGIQYINYTEEMKLLNNVILAVKILVYGFICLVTLIGVTSVFNTINTSIALRRKEFAMLRSVGLTPHGFNKMLYFESIIFGLKSLLYSLPVSIGLVILVHLSMSNILTFDGLMLPVKSIIIAIFAVFIIVIITMMYASNKIKHENILEAIREENI